MQKKLVNTIAAFLLVSLQVATAQQEDRSDIEIKPVTGSIDIGYRATSTAGDRAQYERYRDLRNGAYSDIVFGMETNKYVFSFQGRNAGYRDQYFKALLESKKLNASVYRDSTPLNYSYVTMTPWYEAEPGVWKLSPEIRTAVQNKEVVGIPSSFAAAQSESIYRSFAGLFRLQQRRDDTGFKLKYAATKDFGIKAAFTTSHKTGYQPFGMAFAFNNANELPLPLDNRTNDLSVGFDWVKPQALFTVSVDHSWFRNKFNQIEWDNPLRATDFDAGGDVPYDSRGYSNGNGPAVGRMSAFPDNKMTTISVKGQYRMPRRTTLNATLQISDMLQDDALIPWTSNSVINQPVVWEAFPELAELERPTAEARVRSSNALVTISSHPFHKLEFSARWRHNTHANVSRPFNAIEYVRFDAVPEETGGISFGHSVVRDTLDATVSVPVFKQAALRFGYGYDNFNRTGRSHNDMRDNSFRVSFDTLGNRYVSLRLGYEFVHRVGYGFSEMAVEEGGAQPGLRYYDEADRNRNRVNAVVSLMPIENLDVTASLSYNKDEYFGPGLEFGLLDNTNATYNVGFNFAPLKKLAFGATFGVNEYDAFQKARNANPAPDPTWTDPTRDWTLTNTERVKNIDVYLDLLRVIKRTDVRLSYSYSDSDNAFVHGGPRILELSSIIDANGFPTFEPLPNVTNRWDSLSGDVKVHLTANYGFALGYRYEKLRINDFATINLAGTDAPRIDYLGGLTLGYGNRPYRGSTGTFRIFRTF